jgi:hypothetical protein
MADTRVTPTKIVKTGVRVDALFAAAVIVATTDYVCKNDGRTFIYVKNAGASPTAVICKTPAMVAGLDLAEMTDTVTNAQEWILGPFPPSIFNDGNGDMRFNFSYVTSVTFLVFSV